MIPSWAIVSRELWITTTLPSGKTPTMSAAIPFTTCCMVYKNAAFHRRFYHKLWSDTFQYFPREKSISKLPFTSSTGSFIGHKTKLESRWSIVEEAHVPNSVAAKSLDWYRSFQPCLDTWKMFTLSSSALWRCQVCLKKQRAYFSSQETDRGAGFPWPIFDLDGCSADIQPSRDESHWAPPGKKVSGHWKKLNRDWCMEEKQKVWSKFDRRKEWLLPILCIPDTAAFWSKRQKRRKKMEKKPEVSQRRQHLLQHQLSRWSWAGEHQAWGEHY